LLVPRGDDVFCVAGVIVCAATDVVVDVLGFIEVRLLRLIERGLTVNIF
jgi:hypothetical protein